MNQEIIFGKNSVEALLKSSERSINKIFILKTLRKDSKIIKIIQLAKEQKVPVIEISKEKMAELVKNDVAHQGIVANVSTIKYADLDDVLKSIEKTANNRLLVMLDSIEDPQNLGSIIRSSEILGVQAIIIPRRRTATITATVSKASAGATEFIKIVQVSNLVNTVKKLKEEGFWVFGGEYEEKSKPLYDVEYKVPTLVIVGSEGKGISRLLKESCDELIKIPQTGKTPSLNVANALSIILYEVQRQRKND